MHKPSISILGPGPDVMLIEGFDCIIEDAIIEVRLYCPYLVASQTLRLLGDQCGARP